MDKFHDDWMVYLVAVFIHWNEFLNRSRISKDKPVNEFLFYAINYSCV